MKLRILALVVGFAFATSLWSQTNQTPTRLAVICDDPAVMNVADLLSAALSQEDKVALLERAEIQKALRELALSSASRDPLKLGAMLSADGLLLLERQKEGTNEWLGARLIAVKPGVIIGNARAPWPVTGPGEWVAGVERRFQPLIPKLGVLAREAIPISVVNLRSALRSKAGEEAERQLTLLLIERLTRQREVFVLERRRMDLLTTEKETGGVDESAFWNGSYLLEGVLDRDGFSRDQLTVNASLVPPRGGDRIEIALAGKRDEPGVVADELARRILQSLNRNAAATAWQPEEEARKYFEEAKWAMKWGMIREARAAADAAWALGKHDMDCATVRVKAYLTEEPLPEAQLGGVHDGGGWYTINPNHPEWADEWMRDTLAEHPRGVAFLRHRNVVEFRRRGDDPDPRKLDQARLLLEMFYNFSHTLPAEEPKSGSVWYQLGVELLENASQLLQHYYLFPQARAGHGDQLVELRGQCRDVAAWLARSQSVRDAYWVGDTVVTGHPLSQTIKEDYSIYRCKIRWGALWHERPEDTLAMYRELASSSVFAYLRGKLWSPSVDHQRLVTWNSADQLRVGRLWESFVSELVNDTNVIRRLEGRFFEVADAPTRTQWTNAFEALLSEIYTNEESVVDRNFELVYSTWGLSSLVHTCPDGMPEEVRRRFDSVHMPKLGSMDQAFRNSIEVRAQVQYLREPPPFDMMTFTRTFGMQNYTRSQAAELKPLAATYRSNLVGQVAANSRGTAAQLRGALATLDRMIASIETSLNPTLAIAAQPAPPVAATKPASPSMVVTNKPKPVTNAIQVARFEKIPWERLHLEASQNQRVFAHRITGDELLLDLGYRMDSNRGSRSGVALWNLKTKQWRVVSYPAENEVHLGAGQPTETSLSVELFAGALYLSQWAGFFKYDFAKERWETLPIPQTSISIMRELDGRLFAGNGESLFEILDGGARISLLASSRRRPAVTQLDALEGIGTRAIFPGENGVLRVVAGGGAYEWDGRDWLKLFPLHVVYSPEVMGSCVVFRMMSGSGGFEPEGGVRLLWTGATNAQLCWAMPQRTLGMPIGITRGGRETPFVPVKPALANRLGNAPLALRGSNIFAFVETVDATKVEGRWQANDVLGRHAELIVLDAHRTKPIVIPLRFDLSHGPFPSDFSEPREGRMRRTRTWLEFSSDQLLIGQGTTMGIWLLPVSEIEKRIQSKDQQQQATRDRIARENAVTRRGYDLNADGTLKPEEQTRALADTAYLRAALTEFQSRAGLPMTPDDTRWFDVNNDHQLQPEEESAYTNAQRIIAQQIIGEYDDNEDGVLQSSEVPGDSASRPAISGLSFNFADTNHDQVVNVEELTAKMMNSMLPGLRQMLMPGFARPPGFTGQTFKELVEVYWAQPPRGSQPFGGPGGMPPGATRPVMPTPRPPTTTTNN